MAAFGLRGNFLADYLRAGIYATRPLWTMLKNNVEFIPEFRIVTQV